MRRSPWKFNLVRLSAAPAQQNLHWQKNEIAKFKDAGKQTAGNTQVYTFLLKNNYIQYICL